MAFTMPNREPPNYLTALMQTATTGLGGMPPAIEPRLDEVVQYAAANEPKNDRRSDFRTGAKNVGQWLSKSENLGSTLMPLLAAIEVLATQGQSQGEGALGIGRQMIQTGENRKAREEKRLAEGEKMKEAALQRKLKEMQMGETEQRIAKAKTLQEKQDALNVAVADVMDDPDMTDDEKDKKVLSLYKKHNPSEYAKLVLQKQSRSPAGFVQRSADWERIQAMPDGPEKEAAKQSYLYEWAPSVGYGASPEAIQQRVRTQEALIPAKTREAGSVASAREQGKVEGLISSGMTGIDRRTGKPLTSSQFQAGNYAHRMEVSEKTLKELENVGFDPTSIKSALLSKDAFNAIRDPQQQMYAQSMRNFINATLRRESGAAIAPHEFDSANKQYFANLNDSPEVLKLKRNNRRATMAGFAAEASNAIELIREEYQNILNASERENVSGDDAAALEWLKNNPVHPKAESVRQMLKSKGLL